ncbi:hypothetical protein [Nocardia carnea]|uniref:hypothetical protein n=1 Tax=Nocardia carnea TaxID=37328 RepID=UPI0024540735|nr:hypothetical protein [Nocardia carnea]
MTDVLPPVGTTQSDTVATLAGVLLGEREGAVRIRVADGTWTFDRCDVLGIREYDGRSSEPAGAVLVDIRPGATADFTRRLRIDVGERPLTLAAPPSPAFGDTQLRRLTETWARRLHLADSPHHPATFTFAQTRSHNSSDDGVHCDSLD